MVDVLNEQKKMYVYKVYSGMFKLMISPIRVHSIWLMLYLSIGWNLKDAQILICRPNFLFTGTSHFILDTYFSNENTGMR